MKKYRFLPILAAALLTISAPVAHAEGEDEGETPNAIIYVNRASTDPNPSGLTWASAFRAIQQGIDAAQAAGGGEVWVAKGTYSESRPNLGRVYLRPGVALYGGFTGNETQREARDHVANRTLIDGATANDGLPANPVVVGADDALLDGFIVQGGRGVDTGGMLNNAVSPTIRNCIFRDNIVSDFGGAMRNNNGAAPAIINSIFYNNHAGIHGGAIINDSASPTIIGCTITQNFAEFRGAGIFNRTNSSPLIANCIVWGNPNEDIGNTGTSDPDIVYSNIGSNQVGTFLINADPLFRNPAVGNFALRAASPCIDRGRNTDTAEFLFVALDFNRAQRGFDGDLLGPANGDGSDYDMGALEYRGETALRFHTADTSKSYAIELSELLRIIQFYNSTGYGCAEGTEDGFTPGLAPETCTESTPHDSDYIEQDFRISLSELLRMIQYFNAPDGYRENPDSEDGFEPIIAD